MDTKLFIEKSINVHKSKYDYSKSIYINPQTKVTIGCKEHGDFEQSPYAHIKGHGCSKCSSNRKESVDEILLKSKHVICVTENFSFSSKVNFKCSNCGGVSTSTVQWLTKQNKCKNCSKNKRVSMDDFLIRAKTKHGDLYDYSSVKFNSVTDKVKIKCIRCNSIFEQTANSHYNGCGCPKCFMEKSEYKTNKKVKLPSGEVVFLQGYEPKIVKRLLEVGYSEEDLLLNNRPTIKYFWASNDGYGDDKWHTYHPDIIIKSENRIIEVKSTWTYDGNGKHPEWLSRNKAKEEYSLKAGFLFEFVVLHRTDKKLLCIQKRS